MSPVLVNQKNKVRNVCLILKTTRFFRVKKWSSETFQHQRKLCYNNARKFFQEFRCKHLGKWRFWHSNQCWSLSPNRSWELNTRQNGYDISSDVFGYPSLLQPTNGGGWNYRIGSWWRIIAVWSSLVVCWIMSLKKTKRIYFWNSKYSWSYGLMSSY
jgi:hypothetical protein